MKMYYYNKSYRNGSPHCFSLAQKFSPSHYKSATKIDTVNYFPERVKID